MGIYDREYYREEDRGGMFASRSMVTNLILLNVGIFLADLMFDSRPGSYLSLHSDLFSHPWQIWQLLTYGFVHDTGNLGHILFNMFGLWLFGRDVEAIYGRMEFLRIYLTTIVLSGLTWLIAETASHSTAQLIGASGGVMGIMILYVCHFPRRIFYIWGLLPVPAWALGSLYLLMDFLALQSTHAGDNVAHIAHLGGAAFGLIYFRTGWNLGRLVPQRLSLSKLKLGPKLRIHDPAPDDRDLTGEVDRILEKISREGEASLTSAERAVLEKASRRYQQRRR